jgi:copper oxidase (laccase) domain-containing protein
VADRAGGDLGARLREREDVAWARQVHGTTVLVVDGPGCAGDGDALVTASPGLRVAVRAADCGPLVLAAQTGGGQRGAGCVGVVHVGWRGGRDGIVAAAADAIRNLSGTDEVLGWLGPCIRSCCYRFGEDDLDGVAAVLGDDVRAATSAGDPALDLPAAIGRAASMAGVVLLGSDGRCTACSVDDLGRPRFFSHRARGDAERHGVLACLP